MRPSFLGLSMLEMPLTIMHTTVGTMIILMMLSQIVPTNSIFVAGSPMTKPAIAPSTIAIRIFVARLIFFLVAAMLNFPPFYT